MPVVKKDRSKKKAQPYPAPKIDPEIPKVEPAEIEEEIEQEQEQQEQPEPAGAGALKIPVSGWIA